MTQNIQKNILAIRQISRSLLPLQFSEITLENAFLEMTDYFTESTLSTITFNCSGSSEQIPPFVAQHLHRFVHEALCWILGRTQCAKISIRLICSDHNCRIRLRAETELPDRLSADECISEPMEYRIDAIEGDFTCRPLTNGLVLECGAPYIKAV